MPLVRIDIPDIFSVGLEQIIGDQVHEAMLNTLSVPEDDKFQILTRHRESQIIKPENYINATYSDQLIFIQITLNIGRTTEIKKAFYAELAERLETHLQIRKEDVIISLIEVNKENWSFGLGEMQYGPIPK